MLIRAAIVRAAEEASSDDSVDEGLQDGNAGGDDDGAAFDADGGGFSINYEMARSGTPREGVAHHVQMTRSEVSKEKSSLARLGRRVVL